MDGTYTKFHGTIHEKNRHTMLNSWEIIEFVERHEETRFSEFVNAS